ncbi:hypothetical protein HK096_006230, partial [Nowakowskiella sp. JEL0078]
LPWFLAQAFDNLESLFTVQANSKTIALPERLVPLLMIFPSTITYLEWMHEDVNRGSISFSQGFIRMEQYYELQMKLSPQENGNIPSEFLISEIMMQMVAKTMVRLTHGSAVVRLGSFRGVNPIYFIFDICSYLELSDVNEDWDRGSLDGVILVNTNSLKTDSKLNPFVAISHTWPAVYTPEIMENRILQVKKILNFEYAWMDYFCMPQNDIDVCLDQIRRAGSIYSRADIVAVVGF